MAVSRRQVPPTPPGVTIFPHLVMFYAFPPIVTHSRRATTNIRAPPVSRWGGSCCKYRHCRTRVLFMYGGTSCCRERVNARPAHRIRFTYAQMHECICSDTGGADWLPGGSAAQIYMPSLLLELQPVEPRGSYLSRIVVSSAPWLVFLKVNLHFTHARLAPFSGFVYLNLKRTRV